jgi:uncharacterized protein YqgC (DUF456 family)
MFRTLKIILGIFLIVVGLIALVTPLTPGAWLGLVGLELVGFGFLIPKRIRKLWKAHAVEEVSHGNADRQSKKLQAKSE